MKLLIFYKASGNQKKTKMFKNEGNRCSKLSLFIPISLTIAFYTSSLVYFSLFQSILVYFSLFQSVCKGTDNSVKSQTFAISTSCCQDIGIRSLEVKESVLRKVWISCKQKQLIVLFDKNLKKYWSTIPSFILIIIIIIFFP